MTTLLRCVPFADSLHIGSPTDARLSRDRTLPRRSARRLSEMRREKRTTLCRVGCVWLVPALVRHAG